MVIKVPRQWVNFHQKTQCRTSRPLLVFTTNLLHLKKPYQSPLNSQEISDYRTVSSRICVQPEISGRLKACTVDDNNPKTPSLNIPHLLHVYDVVGRFETKGISHTNYLPLRNGLIYQR